MRNLAFDVYTMCDLRYVPLRENLADVVAVTVVFRHPALARPWSTVGGLRTVELSSLREESAEKVLAVPGDEH